MESDDGMYVDDAQPPPPAEEEVMYEATEEEEALSASQRSGLEDITRNDIRWRLSQEHTVAFDSRGEGSECVA